MRILNARIKNAHYARDFGMVEAVVTLLVKDNFRPVPYEMDVMSFAPRERARTPGALRRCLIENAKRMNDHGPANIARTLAGPRVA